MPARRASRRCCDWSACGTGAEASCARFPRACSSAWPSPARWCRIRRSCLFDEPTAALDPEAARSVRDYVRDLAASRGRTVLLCTHNLVEAEQLCHRLSIVQAGRQVAEGTPAALKCSAWRLMRVECSGTTPGAGRTSWAVPGSKPSRWTASGHDHVPQSATLSVANPGSWSGAAVAAGRQTCSGPLAEAANALEDVYLSLVWPHSRHARSSALGR